MMAQRVKDGTLHGTLPVQRPMAVPQRPVVVKQLVEMDIEQLLIWTYRDQKAHVIIGLGRGLLPVEAALDGIEYHGVSGDGCVQVLRQAIMGCKVDGGGNFVGSAADLHHDAEAIHRAVLKIFDEPRQVFIMQQAYVGMRPEWTDRLPKPVPLLNGRGQPKLRYASWDTRRNYGACEVEFVPSLAWIEYVNALYLMWHEALTDLAYYLRDFKKLRSYEPMLPAAPQTPWLHD